MLLDFVEQELSAAGRVSATRMTITKEPEMAVLATPTLAYAGFAAGWLAGDIIKNIIRGG